MFPGGMLDQVVRQVDASRECADRIDLYMAARTLRTSQGDAYQGPNPAPPPSSAKIQEYADALGIPILGSSRYRSLVGEKYAEAIPNARLLVLPDCGHMVPYEDPEALVQAILELPEAQTA